MITTKLSIITPITTLATLLGSFSVNVYADDFVDEPNVPDESVPIGGSGGTEARDTQSEGATSFDFNNGDKGCDTNHHNCQHVANHGNNKKSSNETPMTKLINKLPNGCMVVKGPTTTERVAGIRTTVEITCEG
jgi:hypothetical protein